VKLFKFHKKNGYCITPSGSRQSPHICRKQLRYTARADIDLNRPKLITKVTKETANLGQYTNKGDNLGQYTNKDDNLG